LHCLVYIARAAATGGLTFGGGLEKRNSAVIRVDRFWVPAGESLPPGGNVSATDVCLFLKEDTTSS